MMETDLSLTPSQSAAYPTGPQSTLYIANNASLPVSLVVRCVLIFLGVLVECVLGVVVVVVVVVVSFFRVVGLLMGLRVFDGLAGKRTNTIIFRICFFMIKKTEKRTM